MARPRRGGFRPPELRGTLGTLLRTTLAQAGAMRDALERGAREGRSRLDDALASRRRDTALAELGARVLELIRQGEIDLDELPELHDVVAHLDELDARDGEELDEEVYGAAPGPGFGPAPGERGDRGDRGGDRGAPPSRSRFDRRGPRGGDESDGTVSSRAWRPPSSSLSSSSSSSSRPAPSSSPRAPTSARVWRPPAADDASPHAPHAPAEAPTPAPAAPARARPPAAKRGGIVFDDDNDDDLADYMHPDDVPSKPRDDG